ncbi:unnamed protein product [Rangifer tarandus platyrhynchus]|uniref:Uncharacterized protein n=2 Tax=Rangifer tarandus platyrhynchus TaxID=3082113 RepID=A0ACB0DW03_RANTA|nr:unnamed protein product [Rangifer tarandus platyrhynchus]CAI9692459.1 unnamed protein product [Rangifer tarandus platyrhynchus]
MYPLISLLCILGHCPRQTLIVSDPDATCFQSVTLLLQEGGEEKGALWWRLEPTDVETSSDGADDRHGSHGPTALSLRSARPTAHRPPLSSRSMLIKPLLLDTLGRFIWGRVEESGLGDRDSRPQVGRRGSIPEQGPDRHRGTGTHTRVCELRPGAEVPCIVPHDAPRAPWRIRGLRRTEWPGKGTPPANPEFSPPAPRTTRADSRPAHQRRPSSSATFAKGLLWAELSRAHEAGAVEDDTELTLAGKAGSLHREARSRRRSGTACFFFE